MRNITRTAANFVDLSQISAHNFDARSYAVAIALIADGLYQHGIIGISAIVAQNRGRSIEVVDHQIDISVIVEVSKSYSTTGVFFYDRLTILSRELATFAVGI